MVTHPLWVQDVLGSITGSGKVFLFGFVVVVFLLFVQNTLFVTTFCYSFCNVICYSILNLYQDL